ncbi:SDR family oxidoreductase [Micromonospora sp. DR5-3]|uniref:SDR family oxidoreductase n=1 Tax=unclassified Micromonospora TaxID=2617518 RepID=UPI0011D74F06|nr:MULTISPECIES: SDR family oxidoreductase [unclassified Micromonospora]MCW3820809.1 SDR family oxidoreductase [Micromonospora sp. DR5-3]TYC11444.1 SDR family oxidoreductase [Micromonospora sp. MP36]
MSSTILITGTSSGLGRRTAEVLAARGHTVVATMREPDGKDRPAAESLVKTAADLPGSIHVVPMDVTSDASVEHGVQLAIGQVGALDVVVNNAGYAVTGIGETVTSQQFHDVLDANLVGSHRVARAVLPHLRARRRGLLVFVSSGSGRLTVPGMGVYSATKFGVEALAQAYRYELRSLGIDVTIVQPGAYPTNLAAAQRLGADDSRLADYAEVMQLTQTFMQNVGAAFASPQPPDPREVADAIASLVESASGTRPDRISVDRFVLGTAVEAINAATRTATDDLLTQLGLGAVTD